MARIGFLARHQARATIGASRNRQQAGQTKAHGQSALQGKSGNSLAHLKPLSMEPPIGPREISANSGMPILNKLLTMIDALLPTRHLVAHLINLSARTPYQECPRYE
jgi:hypothetical protein